MKEKQYIKAIFERLNENNGTACEDCGEVSEICHIIVNHKDNTVKAVCNNCFKSKYRDFLYSEIGEGKPN